MANFVETLLFVASDQLSEFEESEKDILEKTFDNLNYCKDYYQTNFDDIAYFLLIYKKDSQYICQKDGRRYKSQNILS